MSRKRKKLIPKIWIFCEGETEERYFNTLGYENRHIRLIAKLIKTRGADKFIRDAIAHQEKDPDINEYNDKIFCVFDRDQNSNQQLEKAKGIARNKNIDIIYSNPCFEYWVTSHYEYLPAAYEPDDLKNKLKKRGIDTSTEKELYKKTSARILEAINNVKRIESTYEANKLITRESNPSSGVYKIIEYIESLKEDKE